jgi:magnesium-transporting ATPase (P-type)
MASRGTQGACLQDAFSLLQDHGVDARFGMSHAAAAAAMKRHGPNELSAKEEDPMWKRFADKLKEPMIVLLLISAGLSILIGQYDDAVSITLAVLIVITVACVQEYKSDQSLAALSKLAPHGCHVRRDGRLMDVEASQLVPGDILVIAAGDRVPADLRLIECVDLAIDESSLTGENEPSEKTADVLAPPSTHSGADAPLGGAIGSPAAAAFNVPIADRRNCAFMGTLVSSGRGLGLVIDTGMATELGGIMATMEEAEERKSPLQQKMDALSQRLATISFVIIGGITLVGLLERKPLLEMFTIGVSLAVAAIPEGLPIVVTVTLALGVQRMALKRAVVKKLPAVESLGCTSILAMDKTGTLTRNEQTVVEAFTLATPAAWQGAGLAAGTLPGRSASGNALADGSSLLASDSAGLGGASGALWRQAASDPVAAHHLLHDSVLGRGGLVGGARILFSGLGYNPSGGGAVYSAPRATRGGGGGVGSGIAAVTGAKSFSALHDLLPQQPITATADQHVALLLEAATVCNNADIRLTGAAAGTAHSAVAVSVGGGGSQRPVPGAGFNAELSGQPTEGALLVAAAKIPLGPGAGTSGGGASADGRALASAATPSGASLGGLACAKHWYVRTAEAPFSSETKWMAVRGRYIPGAATSSAAGAGATAGAGLRGALASTAATAAGDAASGSDGTATAAAAASRSPTHRPAGSAHAALHAHVPGELIFAKGAVEAVLAMCDFAVVPSGHPQGIPALADALRGDGIRGLLQAQQRHEGGLADVQSGSSGLPAHAAAATGASAAATAAGSGGSVFLPLSFSVAPLDVTMTAAVLAAAETMAREGLRVIAVAKGDQVPSQSRYSGGSADRSAALRFGRAGGLAVAADGTGGTGVLPAGGSMLGASFGAASATPPSPAHAAIGGMVFLGLLGLHDPPREGVIETLAILQEAGVRTCMITGDSMPTAISIATHLGLISEANRRTGAGGGHARQFSGGSSGGAAIVPSLGGVSASSGVLASQPTPTTALAAGLGVLSPTTDQGAAHEVDIEAVQARERVALSGNEIDAMSEEELASVVRSAAVRVFYRTTPKHKMKLVLAFQRVGHVVAMTGDGAL